MQSFCHAFENISWLRPWSQNQFHMNITINYLSHFSIFVDNKSFAVWKFQLNRNAHLCQATLFTCHAGCYTNALTSRALLKICRYVLSRYPSLYIRRDEFQATLPIKLIHGRFVYVAQSLGDIVAEKRVFMDACHSSRFKSIQWLRDPRSVTRFRSNSRLKQNTGIV